MTNHAVYPKLIILSYWNTPSGGYFVEFPQQFRTLISYKNMDHTCFHVFYNKSKKVLYLK